MAEIIRMTADDIIAMGDQFGYAAEVTTNLLSHLESTVGSPVNRWEGDSYNAFAEKFEEIKTQMQNMIDTYNDIETMLDNMVDIRPVFDDQIIGSISENP